MPGIVLPSWFEAHGGEVGLADLLPVTARALVHALDVLASLPVLGDAVAALDDPFAGVVGGEREMLVREAVQEIAEVTRPGGDVLARIEEIRDAEVTAGARDDLHQPGRLLVRNEADAEVRFGLN